MKPRKSDEKVLVGTFAFGARYVRLYLVPKSDSGAVYVKPEDKGLPIIEIGMADSWHEAYGILLHEAFELAYIDLNTRFTVTPAWSGSAAQYLFVATHEQFGEACERVGWFVSKAAPALEKAALKWQAEYKKHNKSDKKKKKV